jgi:thiamine-phosphate pyrophosphorylase
LNPRFQLPRIYPIVDVAQFSGSANPLESMSRFAAELLRGGATLMQYRDKIQTGRQFLSCARELRRITRHKAILIINDRADLCLAVEADGVHLGQDDLSPAAARGIFDAAIQNSKPPKPLWIGFSTHNLAQVSEAEIWPVDYVAIGPVFATSAKANRDPVIGLEGVRQARSATAKPLVAIGGITRENCREVVEAGADSVAVISDLLASPAKALEEFIRVLE